MPVAAVAVRRRAEYRCRERWWRIGEYELDDHQLRERWRQRIARHRQRSRKADRAIKRLGRTSPLTKGVESSGVRE